MDFNKIDIAHLCKYSASSVNEKLAKNFKGSIKDSDSVGSVFVFHSEVELDPFLRIELPGGFSWVSLFLAIPESGLYKDSPVAIKFIGSDRVLGKETIGLGDIEISIQANGGSFSIDEVLICGEKTRALVLQRLYVYVSVSELIANIKKEKIEKLCYVDGQKYGLGGRLNVYASAVLYCSQLDRRMLLLDQSSQKLIEYPVCIVQKQEEFSAFTEKYASKSIKNIIDRKKQYKMETQESQHRPKRWSQIQDQIFDERFKFISRNALHRFKYSHESDLDVSRRAYKKIIPSGLVLRRMLEIEKDLGIYGVNRKTLSLHFRHGNGERYYSKSTEEWGVKPASQFILSDLVFRCFKINKDIERVIIASDCRAVADFLKSIIPSSCEVLFLDYGLQPLGSGCSHNNSYFDKDAKRIAIDSESEEVQIFAQILILSKSQILIGGRSYFFEAVKSFSGANEENIYFVDNADRYVKLPEGFFPVLNSEIVHAGHVVNKLSFMGVRFDGLFLGYVDDTICLTYFDEELVCAKSISGLISKIDDSFVKRMISLRFY